MNIIEISHLIYEYVKRDENDKVTDKRRALDNVDLNIKKGDFTAILGANGSGKSTMSRLMNALMSPTEGVIYVTGKDTSKETDIWDIRKSTGMVFQNPDNQIIASVVEEDVAFGPENIGIPTEDIWKRVDMAIRSVGMELYRKSSPNRLSGGQKQRTAIAGTMAMKPECIILDEPTAMLDPKGRKEVIKTVRELNKKENISIILITHYMEEAVDADRIIVMDRGHILMDGTPLEIFSSFDELKKIRMSVPDVTKLYFMLKAKGLPLEKVPLKREELVEELVKILPRQEEFEPEFVKNEPLHIDISDPVIKIENLTYLYQPGTVMEKRALDNISLYIGRNLITAFIGHTGSGKSTLMQHLNGLLKGSEGSIYVNFRDNTSLIKGDTEASEKMLNIYSDNFSMRNLRFKTGLVFQYPEYQLFETEVLKDVMFGPLNQGKTIEEAERLSKKALEITGLSEEYFHTSPFELSGGQKRRVAIAGVLAMEPEVLILDEPTAGLDPEGRDELFRVIKRLNTVEKTTILLVTHSMEDVSEYADMVAVLEKGRIKMYGTTEEVFRRYKELEELNLSAPEMILLVHDLKDRGIRFHERPGTVSEMCDSIYGLYRKYREAK